MSYLFYAAIIPVIALGYYIYKKDTHSEPLELLAKIFGMGCLTVIPVAILELILGSFYVWLVDQQKHKFCFHQD